MRLFIRLATLALAIFTLYTQAETLNTFLSTRGIIRSDRNPWAGQTTIWPTILLLVASTITIVITLATLAAYAWSVKHANKVNSHVGGPIAAMEIIAHVAIWVGTSIGYRVGKTGNDLWGWSCSSKAKNIQDVFPEVNFDFFCSLQSNAWIASLAQLGVFCITVIVYFLAWRRGKHRELLRHRESLLLQQQPPNGLPRGSPRHHSGTRQPAYAPLQNPQNPVSPPPDYPSSGRQSYGQPSPSLHFDSDPKLPYDNPPKPKNDQTSYEPYRQRNASQ